MTTPTVTIRYYVEHPYGKDWEGKTTYTRGFENEGCPALKPALSSAAYRDKQAIKTWKVRKLKKIADEPKPTEKCRVVRETIIREVMS